MAQTATANVSSETADIVSPSPVNAPTRFWEQRPKCGAGRVFETPEILWAACSEYFLFCENNPLILEKVIGTKDGPEKVYIDKLRAMTVNGLCLFLGTNFETWYNYAKRPGFSEVCKLAESVVYEQKFCGAAADLLNPGLITRALGLADKKEVTGAGGQPLIPQINHEMTPVQAAEVWLDVLSSESVEDQS